MLRRSCIIILAAVIAVLSSCETEVDLIDKSGSKAVVYGLLDASDSVHVIKINKSFIGQGNAFDFAKIPDSSIIAGLDAEIQELQNGVIVKRYPLRDTIITDKDSGLFYTDNNIQYYFNEPSLNTTSLYKLAFRYGEDEISSTTQAVGKAIFVSPSPNQLSITLARSVTNGDPVYAILGLNLKQGKNSVAYEVKFTLFYKEFYLNGDSAQKSITFGGSAPQIESNEVKGSYPGNSIFDKIASLVPDNPNVKQREIGEFQVEVYGAGEELKNYLTINQPLSGIVQERPEYTNIINGLGLFSSRNIQRIKKPLDSNTQKALVTANVTINKKFCSSDPLLSNDPNVTCK